MTQKLATAPEGQGVTILRRITGWDGNVAVPGDIDTIKLWVVKDDGTKVVDGDSITPISSVVLDPTENDDRWPFDENYNFRHHVSGSDLSDADTIYHIEYELTPSSSAFQNSPIRIKAKVKTTDYLGIG